MIVYGAMKIIAPFLLIVLSQPVTCQSGPAHTTGPCSPAITGSGNTIIIKTCGMTEQERRDLRTLLKLILAKEVQSSSVLETIKSYSSPTHGELLPGNDPDPEISADCHPPAEAFKIYLGDSVAWKSSLPLRAIEVGDKDFVELTPKGAGISVDATTTAPDGKIVVNIRDNVFVANPNNTLDRTLSSDNTTLEVTDEYGNRALSIKFLNPRAIKIMGRFSGHGNQIIVNEKDILSGTISLSGMCVGNNGKGAFHF